MTVGLRTPATHTHQRANASRACTALLTMRTRRRSRRSASAPASGASSMLGKSCTKAVNPTQDALWVRR